MKNLIKAILIEELNELETELQETMYAEKNGFDHEFGYNEFTEIYAEFDGEFDVTTIDDVFIEDGLSGSFTYKMSEWTTANDKTYYDIELDVSYNVNGTVIKYNVE